MAATKKGRNTVRKSPVIMVSSTVYGIESLLDQIFGQLRAYGYTVWMSHRGTIPLMKGKSAFSNCLNAVDNCDFFLGIITGHYGSGVDNTGLSITHKEALRAIAKNRPRLFLVHHDVTIARQILKPIRYTRKKTEEKCFCFEATPLLDNINIIDMYESAMMFDIPLEQRTDNWVQTYMTHEDVKNFIEAQFEDVSRTRKMLEKRRSTK